MSLRTKPLTQEFWIMKRMDRSWQYWDKFPSKAKMMRSLKKTYRTFSDDKMTFIPAILTLRKVKSK